MFKNDWEEFQFIDPTEIDKKKINLLICGSDEIWNIHNKDVDFNFYSCICVNCYWIDYEFQKDS